MNNTTDMSTVNAEAESNSGHDDNTRQLTKGQFHSGSRLAAGMVRVDRW